MQTRRVTKARMIELLRGVPLFSSCSKRELSLLAGVAEERMVAPNEIVCRRGDKSVSLFVIIDGHAEVSIRGRPRRRLGPGDFLGEIALLHGRSRTATVIALSGVHLLSIPAWSFNAVLKGQPRMAIRMLKEVSGRLIEAQEQV